MADEPTAADAGTPAPPADGASELRSVHTSTLTELLNQLHCSVLVSTYQAGKLIAVRSEGGRANTHFRNFKQPMGLAWQGSRLAIGTLTQVCEFQNQPDVVRRLPESERSADGCLVPRRAHTTGNIGVHELAYVNDEIWVVNTRFSCLCTLAADSSFVPRWRPPFIGGLSPEDRCHLNGFGVRDGRVRYATALGETDTGAGWRANKARGGVLMDVPSGEFIARGLSMPHSPRWYQNRLWVLESGAGSLSIVDEVSGRLQHVALLPGFTRGLDFVGPFAFIGLSQVRETAVFSGIPITERLPVEQRMCGMWVVDIRSGQTVAFLRFEAGVQEVFAVQVLQGIRFPDILPEGVHDDVLSEAYVLPTEALADVRPAPADKKQE
ncbi:MAG TPA: TIGR03032 family protein [Gemmataceae bacterium]|jgi:uncharacterized protein (TIGR03032 family)|nr:TIGR03032 family protein [Gemmataceae bacterium]